MIDAKQKRAKTESKRTNEDEHDSHHDLQDEGNANENNEGDVGPDVWPLFHHGLQLRGISHQ